MEYGINTTVSHGLKTTVNQDVIELKLEGDKGYGHAIFKPVLPGISIGFFSIAASLWSAPTIDLATVAEGHPILINLAMEGRCQLTLDKGYSIYIKEGQMAVSTRYPRSDCHYPLGMYKGIGILIDQDKAMEENTFLKEELSIDLKAIREKYCGKEDTYIGPFSDEVKSQAQRIWMYFDNKAVKPSLKLATLEFLARLGEGKLEPTTDKWNFLSRTQVEIAKKTEKIITEDLSVQYTVKELAAGFFISETSLKNYFRYVYGENISDYLRNLRMKKASALLTETKDSVSKIGNTVGYSNQSKFAAVFKKTYKVSPLEYRRLKSFSRPKP